MTARISLIPGKAGAHRAPYSREFMCFATETSYARTEDDPQNPGIPLFVSAGPTRRSCGNFHGD